MKKSSLFLALSAVLVVVGLTGTYFSRIPARSVRIAFPVEGGEKGRAVLFLPPKDPGSVQGKAPLVFLCPGIFYPADKFAMMALELARSGYAACALYFPTDPAFPTGSPRRNLAILKGASRFIEERFPEVDPDRKAVFGHSWGVVTALDAAQVDDSINAVVAVGLYVGGELNVKHRNLLLGTGLHDDLNGPETMRKSLKSVSEGRAETEGARLGSFTDKTALELFISPNSIHAAEAVDPHVIGRLIQWLDLSFYGRERSKSPIRVHCHVFFSVILLAGSFLTLMWAGVMLHFLKPSLAKGLWALALAVTGFCLALGPSPASCLVWFMSIFLSGMVSSHYSRSFDTVPAAHGRLADAAGKIVAYVLLFFLAFGISKLLFGMKLLFSNPDNTRAFPFSLFVSYFLYPCALLNGIVEMIRDYSPQVLWIAVSGSLILYIAAICRMERIEEIGSRFLDSFTRWRRFKPTEPPSSKQKILAAVLCAFALLSAFQLYRAGLADMDVLTPYVSFSTKNLIVPVGLWVLFVRTLKEPRRT